MASIHLPIRQLVEFLLRTGSIDSRFTGFDRANEGARIHRRLQKAAGEGYQAEVFLSAEREACGIAFTLEGRADGIFTDENGTVTIDEIKTTTVPYEEITEELNPCHWAQGMVYAAIFSSQQGLDALAVRLTYYQVDTDQNSTLYPAVFPAATGAVFAAAFNAVRPVGAAAAGLGYLAQPEPCGAAIPLCGVPPRAAGAGGRGVPRLPCRKKRRPQGRHPRFFVRRPPASARP